MLPGMLWHFFLDKETIKLVDYKKTNKQKKTIITLIFRQLGVPLLTEITQDTIKKIYINFFEKQ